ncbi:tyrosine-type recombinase/integrase [candidate division CSSED10-310 bacterium]|uniref:Tyrosine-type recombinase/integrase n=1 Tax=candidate division CSSED10-310 bacterium TaxID=2855610 RepID=A0ABV6YQV4_UNCC1
MTPLSKPITSYIQEYLPHERRVSRHTRDTYAYSLQLLICFASEQLKKRPSDLYLEQLDASMICSFLKHIESERKNSAKTRNARLAAIKSFFKYIEYRIPSAMAQTRQINAIPTKKTDDCLIDYLTREELQALLDAPDPQSRTGRRDRAMLHLAFAAGLRVSELVKARIDQFNLNSDPTIHVIGKGRRERVLPLWKETTKTVRDWVKVRGDNSTPEMFLNARGTALTRFGFHYIITKYVKLASAKQPSLNNKNISPHVLRHTCALHILQATNDIRKVALWLGHASIQSTEMYLRADPKKKIEILNTTVSPSLRSGKFRPPDKLIAMIQKRKL